VARCAFASGKPPWIERSISGFEESRADEGRIRRRKSSLLHELGVEVHANVVLSILRLSKCRRREKCQLRSFHGGEHLGRALSPRSLFLAPRTAPFILFCNPIFERYLRDAGTSVQDALPFEDMRQGEHLGRGRTFLFRFEYQRQPAVISGTRMSWAVNEGLVVITRLVEPRIWWGDGNRGGWCRQRAKPRPMAPNLQVPLLTSIEQHF
jgi:hypothetical protein